VLVFRVEGIWEKDAYFNGFKSRTLLGIVSIKSTMLQPISQLWWVIEGLRAAPTELEVGSSKCADLLLDAVIDSPVLI
jgi:hypothetical protein